MEDQQKIIKRPSTFPMFSKHLALQPVTVIDFANQYKKQFQEFNQAFKKRIMIQLQYAKNLEAISKSLDKYIQPGTQKAISFICSAFKVENQQRAHQAKQLAQSLRTQIFQICSNACRDQTTIIKKVQKDVKKYIKQYQSLNDTLERAFQNYQKVSIQTQQLIITKNFLKYTSQIPQQKKTKLISKTMQSIKQKKQYQKLYLSAYRNYNDFVREYNKYFLFYHINRTINQQLNQVQQQVRDQILLQADCLRKLIVCEISMFKNIEYDLINISKQMQALDTQKDVELLVQSNMDNLENLIIDAEEYKKLSSPKQKRKSVILQNQSTKSTQQDIIKQLKPVQSQVDKGMMSVSLKNVQQQVFSSKLLNKKNKEFKQLIDRRWKELNPKSQIEGQNNMNGGKQNGSEKQIKEIQQKQKETSEKQQQKQITSSKTSEQKLTQIVKAQKQQKQSQTQQQTKQITQPPSPSLQQPNPSLLQKQKQQPPTNINLKQHFLSYFSTSSFSKQFLLTKRQEQKNDTINQIYQNFIIITRYINEIWNGQNVTLIEKKKGIKEKVQQTQSPLNHIKKLLGISHFYRIVSYAYIESFRIHHKVMITNMDKAKEISKFISSFLTKSSKQNDVFILRGLLGLIFTYYWIQTNNKKHMYVDNTIYKNSLWKKHDFWDAAIFESTYQQMLSFGAQKGQSLQQTILRQKNLIFSQLASYCHFMIMLGIGSKNVRQIVGRYCRLYEMNDDQNRDLSKMITNTVKQYKEIIIVNIKDSKDIKSEKQLGNE